MSSNKFQHNGFYALHILQNHENQKQHQSNVRKSSAASSSTSQAQQSQLQQNLSKLNEGSTQNKSISNSGVYDGGRSNSQQKGRSTYADYITGKANEYRQQKNSRFESKMQPMPIQHSQGSPKGSNLSVWGQDKENRFEWIGKDQNKYFKDLEGHLKTYQETNPNTQSTCGNWQNLINKTLETEQYQKKRSVSKEGQTCQNTNSTRVLFPDQQETPRFNPCFKSVLMKEQINPSKLEERSREKKVQRKHEKNLESYDNIQNKGIIPDTAGREIVQSRRKSTEIKKKYDYSSKVVLKTEEGQPIKYSPSKVRLMYEEAYNNNMTSLIFQTDLSHHHNDSVIAKKVPQSKNIQSISTLNNSKTINTQVNNFVENKTPKQEPLRESNIMSKPPLSQSIVIEPKQEKKIDNVSTYNTKQQSQYNTIQTNFNTNNINNNNNNNNKDKDKENKSPYQTKKQLEYQSNYQEVLQKSIENRKNSKTIDLNQIQSHRDARDARESVEIKPISQSQQKPIDSARNYYNIDYQFNQKRDRSNSKKRSSQQDVFRVGDRLWTDVREQNIEELNRDPSRERVKTNPSDRFNYSGNQEFWQSQKQDNVWKQEIKLKEIQTNNIVLPDQKKVNRRANSISTNIFTESNSKSNNNNHITNINGSQPSTARQNEGHFRTPSAQQQYSIERKGSVNYNNNNNNNNNNYINYMNQSSTIRQSECNTPFNQKRQNNFQSNDKTTKQFESYIRDNSRSCTPKQYDYSPQQRTKTAGDIYTKSDRDQTPKQFQNIDFSQARIIKEKMQKSQIKFC